MNHTPGPWMTHGQFVITGNDAGPIDAHNAADARLIAAAPQLLEALQAILTLLEQGQPLDPKFDADWIRDTIAKAQEA